MSKLEPRRIRVDWEELEEAFGDSSPDHRYYLDRETGAVHFFSAYLDNEDEEEDERAMTTESRYVLIPHERRVVPSEALSEFVRSLESGEERSRLLSRLSAVDAHRRFEESIAENALVQDQWQRFVKEGLDARIKSWLADVSVEPLD